jgi:hypothetical protein
MARRSWKEEENRHTGLLHIWFFVLQFFFIMCNYSHFFNISNFDRNFLISLQLIEELLGSNKICLIVNFFFTIFYGCISTYNMNYMNTFYSKLCVTNNFCIIPLQLIKISILLVAKNNVNRNGSEHGGTTGFLL